MSLDVAKLYQKYAGQSLLVPGEPEYNRGQCVMWADFALNDSEFGYGLPYHYGNAIDWWYNPGELLENFDKITDGSIKVGDFVIFNTQVGSLYGHIDLAMQNATVVSFMGADSNWRGNKTVHPVQHGNPSWILGSLRYKNQEDEMPNDGDVDNAYLQINGRKATDDEKKVYTSKPWSAGDGLYYGKVQVDVRNLQEALKNAQNGNFVPVGEQLYKKA